MNNDRLGSPNDLGDPDILKKILRAIENVRYGSVEITIHESKVVQIERKEKIRFDKHGKQD